LTAETASALSRQEGLSATGLVSREGVRSLEQTKQQVATGRDNGFEDLDGALKVRGLARALKIQL
jgi:hypothetical protein